MTDREFRAFLDLLMCSDPWPVDGGGHADVGDGGQSVLEALADRESGKRGFGEWIEAYHDFVPAEATP